MTHPAEIFTRTSLAALREIAHSGDLDPSERITPSVYLSWDAEEGEVTCTLDSVPGKLMDLSIRVGRAPRWMTLNIELGPCTLQEGDILGVVAEGSAGPQGPLPVFIRSANEDDTADTWLREPLALAQDHGQCVMMHHVASTDPIAGIAAFHTMIVDLPKQDMTLTLDNLRVFILPASAGLRVAPATTASFAV